MLLNKIYSRKQSRVIGGRKDTYALGANFKGSPNFKKNQYNSKKKKKND